MRSARHADTVLPTIVLCHYVCVAIQEMAHKQGEAALSILDKTSRRRIALTGSGYHFSSGQPPRADTLSVTVSSSITYVFPPKAKNDFFRRKETRECSHFCSPITLKQEMKLCVGMVIFDVPALIVAQFSLSVKRNTDEQFSPLSTSGNPFK